MEQVAVKKLHTSGAPVIAEANFAKEICTIQLASAACQRVCRMLGCGKPDGDMCIVMSLYPKSAAKLLETGQLCVSSQLSIAKHDLPLTLCCCCLALCEQ